MEAFRQFDDTHKYLWRLPMKFMKGNLRAFYADIRKRNEQRWGTDRLRIVQAFGRDLRATARDMILELVQNAEDGRAHCLCFHLYDDGLLIWNDGIPFSDKDVESISGLLISTKDARSIGHFGIGFKSVLLVTRKPYVLSHPHAFWLEQALDPYPVDSADIVPSEAWKLFRAGKTVFWLPFIDASPQYAEQVSRVFEQNLSELLLFMHSLKEIHWESQTVRAEYISTPEVICQGNWGEAQEFRIRFQREGEGENANDISRWLRLDWWVEIPERVIGDIIARLETEGDTEGTRRWKRLSPEARRQTFSVAICLGQGDNPCLVDGRAFTRLPTGYRNDLKFHVSGRFSTTVDRERLREDDPLTCWALTETEQLLTELPELLKRLDKFTPPMWAIFPAERGTHSLFATAVDALRKTLSEGVYFHGDDKDFHLKSEVYLAHSHDLYDILDTEALREVTGNPNAYWVHPVLRAGEPREVIRSLGVSSVEPSHVLRWLQSKGTPWFQERPAEWLGLLYRYLAKHEELRSKGAELPLIRLGTGCCVRPSEALLPPEQLPEALEPYASYLPLVDSAIVRDQDTVEALQRLGVKEFNVDRALQYFFQMTYAGENKPSAKENRDHIRMLFALWCQGEVAPSTLENWSSLPILRTRKGAYIPPNQAYLPAKLGGRKEVEEYFRLAGIELFVAEDYAESKDDPEQWGKLLETLGVVQLPRSGTLVADLEGWEADRKLNEWIANREYYPRHAKRFKTITTIIDGFEQAFNKVQKKVNPDAVRALWTAIDALIGERSDLDFDRLGFHFYYEDDYGHWYYIDVRPAKWLYDLQTTCWLPDDKREPAIPYQLFHPDLKSILGPGFRYVHEKVGVRKDSKLAEHLGICLKASIQDVLNHLAKLSEQGVREAERVKPIYDWLSKQSQNADKDVSLIRRKFQEHPLILIPGQGWFRSNEVCWRDRTGIVPEVSEHWSDQKSFFLNTLQIQAAPRADHLAYTLLGMAEREESPDLSRVQVLASVLFEKWKEISPELQQRLKGEPCWPAREGNKLTWKEASQIYLRDREHIAQLFGDRLPWWVLDGLEDLAEVLSVPRISGAEQEVYWGSDGSRDDSLAQHLQQLWCFVIRFAQPSEIPDTAPEVRRVSYVRVQYRIGGWHWSNSEEVKSHLHRDKWILYLTDGIRSNLAHYIGDALERELNVPNLREFIKDIWDQMDNRPLLEETLQFWERERDVTLTDLLARIDIPEPVPAEEHRISQKSSPRDEHGPVLSGTRQQFREGEALGNGEGIKRGDTFGPTDPPTRTRDSDSGGGESPIREQIAKEAMQKAIQWWSKRGYVVNDVSSYTELGYDLEVTKDNITYFVEVKGTERKGEIPMSENEWEVARKEGGRYYLQVVTIPQGDVYLIRSPATALADAVNRRERSVVRVYYEVPFPAICLVSQRETLENL